jgi:hypothetical protein
VSHQGGDDNKEKQKINYNKTARANAGTTVGCFRICQSGMLHQRRHSASLPLVCKLSQPVRLVCVLLIIACGCTGSVDGRSIIVEVCAQKPGSEVCSDVAIISIDLPDGVPFPQQSTGSVALPGFAPPSFLTPLVVYGLSTQRVRVAFYDTDGVRHLDVNNRDNGTSVIVPALPISRVVQGVDGINRTFTLRLVVIESARLPFFRTPVNTKSTTPRYNNNLQFAGYSLTESSLLALFILLLAVTSLVWTSLFLWFRFRCYKQDDKYRRLD